LGYESFGKDWLVRKEEKKDIVKFVAKFRSEEVRRII